MNWDEHDALVGDMVTPHLTPGLYYCVLCTSDDWTRTRGIQKLFRVASVWVPMHGNSQKPAPVCQLCKHHWTGRDWKGRDAQDKLAEAALEYGVFGYYNEKPIRVSHELG